MGTAIRYSRWSSQPQYPAGVNLAHPLAAWVLASFNAGESLRFGQSFPTTIGGTPTVGVAGKCVDYPGNTKTQFPFDATIANGMVTAAGCAVLVIFDVDTLVNYGCLFSSEQTGTTRIALEVRLGLTSSDSWIDVTRATTIGYTRFDSGSNRVAAGDKSVRLLVSFADNVATTVPTLYINGVKITMALGLSNDSGTVAAPTSVGVTLGGRSADTVTPLDGRIYNAWVFGRGVTAAEGIALTKDIASPYALFAPLQRRIWVPSAAPPGGFLAAWARNSNSIIQGARV